MQKNIGRILIISGALTLSACSSKTNTSITQQPPSFLPNYSLLKPIPSPENTQLYAYKDPSVKLSDYEAAIVEPVSLYQTAPNKDVTAKQIETARNNINANLKKIVSQKIALTQTPGQGVFRVQVAITGASFQEEGFKPWNVIPISAAIKLASMATDNDSKKPVLVVEIKITDTQSGKLLKEVVSTINGESFRGKDQNTANTFAQLANQWVQEALKYSNQNL